MSTHGRLTRGEQWGIVSVLALATLFLALLARPLFSGKVYVVDDFGGLYLPVKHFYARCLAQGQSPFWIPNYYNGFYLHADGLVGMCHPFTYLIYRFFPFATALMVESMLPFALLFPGTYLLQRRLGLPPYPAVLGAFLFAFGGWTVPHYIHINVMSVLWHLPWLLLCVHILSTSTDAPHQAVAFASLSLLTGSQALSAFPQMQWISILGEVALASWLLLRPGTIAPSQERWRRAFLLGSATGLGVLVGGMQIVPTLNLLTHTARMDKSAEFRFLFSQHPADFAQWFAPYFHYARGFTGYEHACTVYNGAFCTAAVVWIIVRWRSPETHLRLGRAALIFGALMCFLALGKYNGLYQVLVHVPPFGLFRAQYRHMALTSLALSTIGSVAALDLLNRLRQGEAPVPWRRLWPFVVPPALGVFLGIVLGFVWHGQLHDHWVRPLHATHPLVGVGLVTLACGLMAFTARGARWTHYVFPILIFVDMALWGIGFAWKTPSETPDVFVARRALVPPTAMNGGSSVEGARIHYTTDYLNQETPKGEGIFVTGLATVLGHRITSGYVQLAPRQSLDPDSTATLRLTGAGWARDAEGWRRVPDPLPRVRLVSDVHLISSPNEARERVNGIDLERTVLVDRPMELGGSREAESAFLAVDEPGHVEIATNVTGSGARLLVLSEGYYDGWTATIDGQPTPVLRVNGDFQGCVVPAGEHRVVFHFAPRDLRLGVGLTAAGLALTLIGAFLITRWGQPPKGRTFSTSATTS